MIWCNLALVEEDQSGQRTVERGPLLKPRVYLQQRGGAVRHIIPCCVEAGLAMWGVQPGGAVAPRYWSLASAMSWIGIEALADFDRQILPGCECQFVTRQRKSHPWQNWVALNYRTRSNQNILVN